MDIYKIAFSTIELDGKIPPGSPIWPQFNASFENYEATIPAMAYMIDDGRAFTTWHANNWRQNNNFICGQHLGIDFDTLGIDSVLGESFVQRYGALVYATPSSTPEAPRSRALFVLDTPIMQASNYTLAVSALIWSFGGTADRQCKDAARFFYGSLGSMPTRLDNVLPLAVVRELIGTWQQWQTMQAAPHPTPTTHTGDDNKAIAGALRFAADASQGERNTSLYWAARRWAERSIPQGDAETMAVQVARSNGLEDAEAFAVVRSAYRGPR